MCCPSPLIEHPSPINIYALIDADECPICVNQCFNVGKNISCSCPLSADECSQYFECETNCINGVCSNGSCVCDIGYTGTYCDVKGCGNQICSNRSTCMILNGSYSCQCLPGYVGANCHGNLIMRMRFIIAIYLC